MKSLEVLWKNVVDAPSPGFLLRCLRGLLWLLSCLFAAWVTLRNFCYDRGWMRCFVPPVPLVISVGNIVAGGAGKTPVLLWLMKHFQDSASLAILTRGYRSQAEKLETPLVICQEAGVLPPPAVCGDEPFLIAKKYPKAMIFVGYNRKKACKMAGRSGAQIVLLDDAFQHRRLGRDFDIVVVDGRAPLGAGFFLPRGYLRDSPSRLAQAHIIFINRVQNADEFYAVKKELLYYTRSPMVGIRQVPVQWHMLTDKGLLHSSVLPLSGKKVGLFCAIAHPRYFRELIEELGGVVVGEQIFPDHDPLSEDTLRAFAAKCRENGAEWLVCTEKDGVKLREDLLLPLPVGWVEIEVEVVAGHEECADFFRQAKAKIY